MNNTFIINTARSCLTYMMRTISILQTMCGLVKGAFAQSKSKGSYGFDVIDLLIGFDQAEKLMQVRIDNRYTLYFQSCFSSDSRCQLYWLKRIKNCL